MPVALSVSAYMIPATEVILHGIGGGESTGDHDSTQSSQGVYPYWHNFTF